MKTRVIVCALISKDDKYLFIKQNKSGGAYPNTLHIPGGGIDEGEDVDLAVRREIFEETGVRVKNLVRYNFDADVVEYKGNPTHLIFLQYTCEWDFGDAVAGSDAAEIIWLSKNEIRASDHSPPSQRLLRGLGLLGDG